MSRTSPIEKRLYEIKGTVPAFYLCGLCRPLISRSRCRGRRAHPNAPALDDVAFHKRCIGGDPFEPERR